MADNVSQHSEGLGQQDRRSQANQNNAVSKLVQGFDISGNSRTHVDDVNNRIGTQNVNNIAYDRNPLSTLAVLASVAIVAIFGLFLASRFGRVESAFHTLQQLNAVADKAPSFKVPYARDPQFIGLTGILKQLRQSEKTKDHHRAALHGMQGVGKTSLAIEYTYDFHARHTDASVFWIDASTRGQLNASFQEIGVALGVELPGIEAGKGAMRRVRDLLADYRNGRWLLVVNDLETSATPASGLDSLQDFLDYIPHTLNCEVLLTTTDRNVAHQFTGQWSATFQIGPFRPLEAAEFFKSKLRKDLFDVRSIRDLAEGLDYLPFALTQVIAHMNRYSISSDQFLSWQLRRPDTFTALESREGPKNLDLTYNTRMLETFGLTLSKLAESHSVAFLLLEIASLFEAKFIPASILRGSTQLSDREFAEAIGELQSQSLLSLDQASGTFSMHRLIHSAMRLRLFEEAVSSKENPFKGVPESGEVTGPQTDHVIRAALAGLVHPWSTSVPGNAKGQDLWARHALMAVRLLPVPPSVMSRATMKIWKDANLLVMNYFYNKAEGDGTDVLSQALFGYIPAGFGLAPQTSSWTTFMYSTNHTASEHLDRGLFVLELGRDWGVFLQPVLDCIFAAFSARFRTSLHEIWHNFADDDLTGHSEPSSWLQVFVVCGEDMTRAMTEPWTQESPIQSLHRSAAALNESCDSDTNIRIFAVPWIVWQIRERCAGVVGILPRQSTTSHLWFSGVWLAVSIFNTASVPIGLVLFLLVVATCFGGQVYLGIAPYNWFVPWKTCLAPMVLLAACKVVVYAVFTVAKIITKRD